MTALAGTADLIIVAVAAVLIVALAVAAVLTRGPEDDA